jgi:hypothetical protein
MQRVKRICGYILFFTSTKFIYLKYKHFLYIQPYWLLINKSKQKLHSQHQNSHNKTQTNHDLSKYFCELMLSVSTLTKHYHRAIFLVEDIWHKNGKSIAGKSYVHSHFLLRLTICSEGIALRDLIFPARLCHHWILQNLYNFAQDVSGEVLPILRNSCWSIVCTMFF